VRGGGGQRKFGETRRRNLILGPCGGGPKSAKGEKEVAKKGSKPCKRGVRYLLSRGRSAKGDLRREGGAVSPQETLDHIVG